MQIKNKFWLLLVVAVLGASKVSYGMEEVNPNEHHNISLASKFVNLGSTEKVNKFMGDGNDYNDNNEMERAEAVLGKIKNGEDFSEMILNKMSEEKEESLIIPNNTISNLLQDSLNTQKRWYLETFAPRKSRWAQIMKCGLGATIGVLGALRYSYYPKGNIIDLPLPILITAAAAYYALDPLKRNIVQEPNVFAEEVTRDVKSRIFYPEWWNKRLNREQKLELSKNAGVDPIDAIVNLTWQSLTDPLKHPLSDKIRSSLNEQLDKLLIENLKKELADVTWFKEEDNKRAIVNRYIKNKDVISNADAVSDDVIKWLMIAKKANVTFELINEEMWKRLAKDEEGAAKKIQKLQILLPGFFKPDNNNEEIKQLCTALDENWNDLIITKLLNKASLANSMNINVEEITITAWNDMSKEQRHTVLAQSTELDDDDLKVASESNFLNLGLKERIAVTSHMIDGELFKRTFELSINHEFQRAINEKYNNSRGMWGANVAQFALLTSIFGLTLVGYKKFMKLWGPEWYKKAKEASALFVNDKIHKRISKFFWSRANAFRAYTEMPLPEFEDTRNLGQKKT